MDAERALTMVLAALFGMAIKALFDKKSIDKLVDAINGHNTAVAVMKTDIDHYADKFKQNERDHDEIFCRLRDMEKGH